MMKRTMVHPITSLVGCERVTARGVRFEESFALLLEWRSYRIIFWHMCTPNRSLCFKIWSGKTAYRHGRSMKKCVCQPEGFINAYHPSHVYKLKKGSIWVLKQAPQGHGTMICPSYFYSLIILLQMDTIDPTLVPRLSQRDEAPQGGLKRIFVISGEPVNFKMGLWYTKDYSLRRKKEKLVRWSQRKDKQGTVMAFSTAEAVDDFSAIGFHGSSWQYSMGTDQCYFQGVIRGVRLGSYGVSTEGLMNGKSNGKVKGLVKKEALTYHPFAE
ncbi:hypothetical protein Tco_0635601 [Tanacetum coccineum]